MCLSCASLDNGLPSLRCPILRMSRTRFPSSIVVGTEKIGSCVLFVPRASSAGKAISRSDPPMAEYRPLKSQPRVYGCARARALREGPSFSFLSSAIDSRDLTCPVTATGQGPSLNTQWPSIHETWGHV